MLGNDVVHYEYSAVIFSVIEYQTQMLHWKFVYVLTSSKLSRSTFCFVEQNTWYRFFPCCSDLSWKSGSGFQEEGTGISSLLIATCASFNTKGQLLVAFLPLGWISFLSQLFQTLSDPFRPLTKTSTFPYCFSPFLHWIVSDNNTRLDRPVNAQCPCRQIRSEKVPAYLFGFTLWKIPRPTCWAIDVFDGVSAPYSVQLGPSEVLFRREYNRARFWHIRLNGLVNA